jgi:hypothetical protein
LLSVYNTQVEPCEIQAEFRLKFSYNQYLASSGYHQVTLLSVYNTQVEPCEIQAEIQADFQAENQAEIQLQPILIILRLSRASPSNFAVSLQHSSRTL